MALLSRLAPRWRTIGLAAALALAPALAFSAATEYQIKAVFLYNFAEFVDWPAGSFPDPQAPLVIGILGDDPFGSMIDEAVKGERVSGRPIVIRRFRTASEISGCQILFISRSEKDRLPEIMRDIRDMSVLTVSDADGFSRAGGMIRFIMENNKVRLRINPQAAKQARLSISSKLLRPAQIVKAGED
ncbi:MAG TPA: YfiR family protein [Opitutaceae bacterium]|jgi:hypothetical protein